MTSLGERVQGAQEMEEVLGSSKRWITLICALGGGLAFLLLWTYLGFFQRVYVVGGLDQAYEVSIGGKNVKVPAHGWTTVKVSQGKVLLKSDSPFVKQEEFIVETPFLGRTGKTKTFVINPDGLGILEFKKNEYLAETIAREHKEFPSVFHANQVFYEFQEIDYPFKAFPSDLMMESEAEIKTGLELVEGYTPAEKLEGVASHMGLVAAQSYALRQLEVEGFHPEAFAIMMNLFSEEKLLEFLKQYPPKGEEWVDWHLYSTQIRTKLEPTINLVPEYQKIAKENPDSGDAQYILSTLVADSESIEAYLEASVRSPKPSGQGFRALTNRLLNSGRFDEALKLSDQARAILPDHPTFAAERLLASLVLGKLKQLEEAERKVLDENPEDPEALHLLAEIAHCRGDYGQARSYTDKLAKKFPDRALPLYREIAFFSGQTEEYEKLSEGDQVEQFHRDMRNDDVDFKETASPWVQLLGSLQVWSQGKKRFSEELRNQAVEQFKNGTPSERRLAADMDSKQAIVDANLSSYQTATLLTLAAIRKPELRAAYCPLAKKLCSIPVFPNDLITRSLKKLDE